MPGSTPLEFYLFAAATLGLIVFLLWMTFSKRADAAIARALADNDSALVDQICASAERAAAAEERASRIPELEQALLINEGKHRSMREELLVAQSRAAELETQIMNDRKAHAEKISLLDKARSELAESFRTLSADALRQNSASFVAMATAAFEQKKFKVSADFDGGARMVGDALRPVQETVDRLQLRLAELELARNGAYDALGRQVRELLDAQQHLRHETAHLAKTLGGPGQRGRWGEIQLRRAAELSGMIAHCDFFEPPVPSAGSDSAHDRRRPDMIVRLPGNRSVVVDGQAPVQDYVEALSALTHEDRVARLQAHASGLRAHIRSLAGKAYWEQFEPAPEFVVLFLPGEAFFSAALDTDPALIEFGVEKRVLIATPMTLIALLRAVHYGWKQETQISEARQVSSLGTELHERLAVFGERLTTLGRSITGAVDEYNETVGDLVSTVLPKARELRERLTPAPGQVVQAPPHLEKAVRLPLSSEIRREPPPAERTPPPSRSARLRLPPAGPSDLPPELG